MKILIIGSCGFIGSSLIKFFEKKNFDVWGCDVSPGYGLNNYFQVDATNSNYHDIFANSDYDVCINCSGAASVPLSLEYPLKDYQLNVSNVVNILDAIRQYRPSCKFINLSSAAVYGNPKSLPITEHSELNPISPYGNHKVMAEMVLKEYANYFRIDCCSLRIFSAYGVGLRKQLFWDLYNKSIGKSEIELFGTGLETRDFIHVYDICSIIELIIRKREFNEPVMNVGNGMQTTIKDVCGMFFQSLGREVKLNFNGVVKDGDPLFWEADISNIKKIGYTQKIGLVEGLKELTEWLVKEK